MASPNYAATTVISERLINRCLTTYLANLAGPQSANVSLAVPQIIAGTPRTVFFDAEFFVISVKASLLPNPQGIITLTFRFYADATVTAWSGPSRFAVPLASFSPEIVLSCSVSVPMVAQVVGAQFQLGANLSLANVSSFSLDLLRPSLPSGYQAAVTTALANPAVPAALTGILRGLAAGGILPATNGMVPAFYDMTMQRPLNPSQQWFNVRVPVTQLVFQVGYKKLTVGVNVAPYTVASLGALSDFISPDPEDRRQTVDVETTANLQFLEDFLNNEVFPRMRNEFIAQQLRLNQVSSFSFKTIGTQVGYREGLEMVLDLTYWTDNFGHFVIAGTTAVNARVTMHGYPRIQYGRLYFVVNDLNIKLPPWVTAATIALQCVLPLLSLAIPILVDKLLHDTAADVLNSFNGAAISNSLGLKEELLLPGTRGPLYGMTNVSVGMNANLPFKVFEVSGDFGPPARITPRLTCNVEEVSTKIPPGFDQFDIRNIGQLPGYVIVSLYVPDGLIHPRDPSVRVRWQVLFNGTPVGSLSRDVPLRDANSKELRVIPLLFTNPNRTDQDIAILCRLYRPLGTSTEEFLNQRINVFSVDPRPDDQKPYIQWSHIAKFWNGYKWVYRLRHSKIHKLPGKGGCKFSNQYLNPALRSKGKFGSIRHFVDLPFEPVQLQQNLSLVCPYCFFGGPDKTPGRTITQSLDLASRIGAAGP
jgi:hypothetical protein